MSGDKFPHIMGIIGLIDTLIGLVLSLAAVIGVIILFAIIVAALFG